MTSSRLSAATSPAMAPRIAVRSLLQAYFLAKVFYLRMNQSLAARHC